MSPLSFSMIYPDLISLIPVRLSRLSKLAIKTKMNKNMARSFHNYAWCVRAKLVYFSFKIY